MPSLVWLVFSLFLNQMSYQTMFPTSHLRTRNQTSTTIQSSWPCPPGIVQRHQDLFRTGGLLRRLSTKGIAPVRLLLSRDQIRPWDRPWPLLLKHRSFPPFRFGTTTWFVCKFFLFAIEYYCCALSVYRRVAVSYIMLWMTRTDLCFAVVNSFENLITSIGTVGELRKGWFPNRIRFSFCDLAFKVWSAMGLSTQLQLPL